MNGTAETEEESMTKIEQEALERKLSKAQELVVLSINNSIKSGSVYLDLTNKGLESIPEELLWTTQLEFLYLEGNRLEILPEDFFQKLPNLRWLDLRYNKLKGLPSAYLGSHSFLNTLLLEGNKIQSLPLELGLVQSLTGLNLRDNPIKFPSIEVLSGGLPVILKYLKNMLEAKTNGDFNGTNGVTPRNEDSEDETFGKRSSSKTRVTSRTRPMSGKSDTSEITGKTVSLHRQTSYRELKSDKTNKFKSAGAFGKASRSTVSREVNLFPEPPGADLIDMKVRERAAQAAKREKNEKIDAILQRRKNEDKLKDFREKSKGLQKQKDIEKYMNGGILDFSEPAREAPYDIGEEELKMLSNEERIKMGVRVNHERIRKVLSPRAIRERELEKAAKDRELQDKIRNHTKEMKQRRKKPKGNPVEEMEAAMRELEIAKRLQTELDRRRRDLDIRTRNTHSLYN